MTNLMPSDDTVKLTDIAIHEWMIDHGNGWETVTATQGDSVVCARPDRNDWVMSPAVARAYAKALAAAAEFADTGTWIAGDRTEK